MVHSAFIIYTYSFGKQFKISNKDIHKYFVKIERLKTKNHFELINDSNPII